MPDGRAWGPQDPHAGGALRASGAPLATARAAAVLVHGRGASADDILALGAALRVGGVAYLAPEARAGTWYPHSFLASLAANEPGLTSALAAVGRALDAVADAGVPAERTLLLGFSQGACLAAEYAARHARRWGGLAVLSGGLIGPDGTPRDYAGALDGTPVFLGCSDRDPHVPAARVRESATVFERLGGRVDLRIYPGMPHTVVEDEIEAVRAMLRALVVQSAPTAIP